MAARGREGWVQHGRDADDDHVARGVDRLAPVRHDGVVAAGIEPAVPAFLPCGLSPRLDQIVTTDPQMHLQGRGATSRWLSGWLASNPKAGRQRKSFVCFGGAAPLQRLGFKRVLEWGRHDLCKKSLLVRSRGATRTSHGRAELTLPYRSPCVGPTTVWYGTWVAVV